MRRNIAMYVAISLAGVLLLASSIKRNVELENKHANLKNEYETLEYHHIQLCDAHATLQNNNTTLETKYKLTQEKYVATNIDKVVAQTKVDILEKQVSELEAEITKLKITNTPTPKPTATPTPKPTTKPTSLYPEANHLTAYHGVYINKNGYKETWYNLPMHNVVRYMRERGYSEKDYPYWIREDGVKMFGKYVMVAADLSLHPFGTIVHTSLGAGMVVDTGEFVKKNRHQFDIAVNWG